MNVPLRKDGDRRLFKKQIPTPIPNKMVILLPYRGRGPALASGKVSVLGNITQLKARTSH